MVYNTVSYHLTITGPRKMAHTVVSKSSQEGKQNGRINNALSQVGGNHINKVLPLGIVELDCHDEKISHKHQSCTNAHQMA